MVENTRFFDILTHAALVFGACIILFPVYLVFIGATHSYEALIAPPIELLPGDQLLVNLSAAWEKANFGRAMLNSLLIAVAIVAGKATLGSITAFAIVYYRFPGREAVFWLIFVTLMLPVEVRIVPTYEVASNMLGPFQAIADMLGITSSIQWLTGYRISLRWNTVNSYVGIIVPLIATATGTFLFRQFFRSIPSELVEAAKMDGAGPIRFMIDILLPLSKTMFAALSTIIFIGAWNQYLWPLMVATENEMRTSPIALRGLIPSEDAPTQTWHLAMAGAIMTMTPPVLVILFFQRWFVRGLVSTEK